MVVVIFVDDVVAGTVAASIVVASVTFVAGFSWTVVAFIVDVI